MIIDHVGMFFFPEVSYFRAIGRVAFPIFLFLVGYSQKYEFSTNLLLWGALITAMKFYFNFSSLEADILITIFLTRILFLALTKYELLEKCKCEILLLFTFLSMVTVFLFAYGTIAFLFAYVGYLIKKGEASKFEIKVTTFYILLINFVVQFYSFEFKGYEFPIIFTLVSVLLYFMLVNFKLFKVTVKTKIFEKSLIYISRNALHIYVLHYIIFTIVAKAL